MGGQASRAALASRNSLWEAEVAILRIQAATLEEAARRVIWAWDLNEPEGRLDNIEVEMELADAIDGLRQLVGEAGG